MHEPYVGTRLNTDHSLWHETCYPAVMRIHDLRSWLVPTFAGPWLAMVAFWLFALVMGWLDGGHVFPNPVWNFVIVVSLSTIVTLVLSIQLVVVDVFRLRRGTVVPTGIRAWLGSVAAFVLFGVVVTLVPLPDCALWILLGLLAVEAFVCAVVSRLIAWRPHAP